MSRSLTSRNKQTKWSSQSCHLPTAGGNPRGDHVGIWTQTGRRIRFRCVNTFLFLFIQLCIGYYRLAVSLKRKPIDSLRVSVGLGSSQDLFYFFPNRIHILFYSSFLPLLPDIYLWSPDGGGSDDNRRCTHWIWWNNEAVGRRQIRAGW